MNKTWITFRYELGCVLRRASFWVAVLTLPMIMLVGLIFMRIVNNQGGAAGSNLDQIAHDLITPPDDTRPQGYVDELGLIRLFPPDFDSATLLNFADEASANQALVEERISGYYLLTEAYLETGMILFYQLEGSPMQSGLTGESIYGLIAYNLLDGDQSILQDVLSPVVEVRETDLSPQTERPFFDVWDEANRANLYIPYAIQSFYMLAIMTASGLLLASVAREQENQVMEVLITSSSPFSFLLGKTLALGLAALFQVAAWGGFSLAFSGPGSNLFGIEALRSLSPTVLAWGILFFFGGYLLYSSLMVSVGVLLSGLREYSLAAVIVSTPLMMTLMLFPVTFKDPNGPLSVGLSFFPLSAPVSMLVRLSIAPVPAWQAALSLVLLFAGMLFCVRLTASLFRGQLLLGGHRSFLKSLVPARLRLRNW